MDQTGIIYALCLFTMISAFMSGFCLLLFFRNNNRLKEIHLLFESLAQKVRSFEDHGNIADNPFKCQLDKEEFKSRFETITALKTSVPEKYRHVAQLERSGLGVQDIAEILDVSQNEAEQMLSLARLSKKHQNAGR